MALIPIGQRENGETALIRAATAGHRDIVAYLLRFQTDNGAETLVWAAEAGRTDTVEQILAFGVDPNTTVYKEVYEASFTPLYEAASSGHTDIVKQLLAGRRRSR